MGLEVKREAKQSGAGDVMLESGAEDVLVAVDFTEDPELQLSGIARELLNQIQRLRKDSQLQPTDKVDFFVEIAKKSKKPDISVAKCLEKKRDQVEKPTGFEVVLGAADWEPGKDGEKVKITITRNSVRPLQLPKDDAAALTQWLASWDP